MSEAISTVTVRKRNRDPLSVNAHEQRSAKESQLRRYWLETRARDDSRELVVSRFLRAVAAAAARWGFNDNVCIDDDVDFVPDVVLGPGDAERRRAAIEFVFVVIHGAPEEPTWREEGIIGDIMRRLGIRSESPT